jgi:hypothetical protein
MPGAAGPKGKKADAIGNKGASSFGINLSAALFAKSLILSKIPI